MSYYLQSQPGSVGSMPGVRSYAILSWKRFPIRVRHPESNGRIEHYHHSVREEAFVDREAEDLYRARDLLGQWVRYYDDEQLHSALNYRTICAR